MGGTWGQSQNCEILTCNRLQPWGAQRWDSTLGREGDMSPWCDWGTGCEGSQGTCVGCGTGQASRWSLRIWGVRNDQGSSTQECLPRIRYDPGGDNRAPQDWGCNCRAHGGTPLVMLQDMGGV